VKTKFYHVAKLSIIGAQFRISTYFLLLLLLLLLLYLTTQEVKLSKKRA